MGPLWYMESLYVFKGNRGTIQQTKHLPIHHMLNVRSDYPPTMAKSTCASLLLKNS